MREDLRELTEKLDSIDSRKAWGEIAVRLINAITENTEKTTELIKSMERSSDETNKINRLIMYLTIAVSISALVDVARNLLDFINR